MSGNLKRIVPLVILIVILATGWVHRYWLFDTYRIAFFEPSLRVEQLASLSGMSQEGERLYLGAQPQLLLEDSFDKECQFAELGLVLGCYRQADIFILDVTEEQLEPVEIVTAAHEMLHVVYSRLNDGEERRMEGLLDRQFKQVTNERVLEEIDGYRNDPNADLYNEMHSIFGTELADILPELEQHYARYFSDRSKVVAQSDSYEAVFVALEDEIEKFDAELSSLERRIDSLEAEVGTLRNQITTERSRLDALLAANDVQAYNASVPGFNALVLDHNQKVESVKRLIEEFNSIVAVRNENVAAKNNLIKSLDSNVETIE